MDAQGFSTDSDNLINTRLISPTINGADITSNDGDLMDMSAIDASGTTEGLILPQAADVSAATAEGQVSWDIDDDTLYVGDGRSQTVIASQTYVDNRIDELPGAATATDPGFVELADSTEAAAGSDTTRAVTAAGVKAYVDAQGFGTGSGDITTIGDAGGPTAFTGDNDGNRLVFEGSTDDDYDVTVTVADPDGDVTVTIPATSGTLALSSELPGVATATDAGLVELADSTEAAAGTDTTRAVTAAGVKAYVDAQGFGTGSGDITTVGDAGGPTAFTGDNDGNQLVFEGSTDDANEVTVTVADPDSDVTVVIPATGGTLALSSELATSATDTAEGLVELATTTEVAAGTDTTRAVTAAGVKAYVDAQGFGTGSGDITTIGDADGPTAFTGDNDGNQLVFEGSTDDDYEVTVTVTDPESDVTVTIPATSGTLALSDQLPGTASATDPGLVELADSSEAAAGTDTTRAVTAAGVKAYVDAQGFSTESDTLAGKTLTSPIINGANITSNDGDLVDLSAINASSTDEGLILPQASDVSAATAEGQVSWDTDGDTLYVGDGTSQTAIASQTYVDTKVSALGSGDITTVGDAVGPTAFTGDNDGNQLVFEGSTDDANEVTITAADPDSDVTVTIPAATGTVALTSQLPGEATVTDTGLVELADTTEAAAGTDTTRAITAAGVKAYVDAQGFGTGSGDITAVGDTSGPTAFTGDNDGNQLVFEGGSDDENDLTLQAATTSSAVTVTIPAATGTLALTSQLPGEATATDSGLVELATTTEVTAGTDTTRAVTAAGVKAYVDAQGFGTGSGDITTVGDATGPTTFTGDNDGNRLVFEGSTDDDYEVTVTATDPDSDVTVTFPATSGTLALSSQLPGAATSTDAGIVELADSTEAAAGTDTTRAVTAAGVKAYVDAQGFSTGPDALADTTLTSLTINGANITSNDGDLVDMSAIDPSSTAEGLILPQAADVSAATAEGQIAWDAEDNILYVGDGTSQTAIASQKYVDNRVSDLGSGDITAVGDATGPTAFTGDNDGNRLVFEGSTDDDYEVTVTVADPDSDVSVTIPAASGTLALSSELATSATETTEGLVELATTTEATNGTDTTRAVTAAGVKAYVDSQGFGTGSGDITTIGDADGPTAFTGDNDGNQLVFEGSTDDANEVTVTVADPNSDVTVTIPAASGTLALSSDLPGAATTTGPGLVELADSTEAADGTDTTRAITAAGVKAYVDAQDFGTGSGDITTIGDAAGPTAFTGDNDGNRLVFEGGTDDDNDLTLQAATPTSAVTVTIPATTTTLVGTDTTDTLSNKTLDAAVLNNSVSGTAVLDEDTMASDSDTRLATQQSIKAYVDNKVSVLGSGDITTVGDASGPTAFTGDNDGNRLVFEGGTDDDYEVTVTVADPDSDVTVTIPATSGTLALSSELATGATETNKGLVELADSTEAAAGTDTTRAVTAAGVKAYVDAQDFGTGSGDITAVGDAAGPTAFTGDNDGNRLVFEGSTDDDYEVTVTATDPDSDVTVTIPATSGTLAMTSELATSATETAEGLVELATTTEASNGTDTARAVTAAGVKAYVDAQGFGTGSGDITTVGDAAGPTAFTGANDGNRLVFEGGTDDDNDLTLQAAATTSDVIVTIPATSGTLALSSELPGVATATEAGLVELADTTEATNGTDTTRAVTAAGVKAYVDAQGFGTGSGDITTIGDASGPTAFTGDNDGNQLVFEGGTDDDNDLTLQAATTTSAVTVTIPAATGTLALNSQLPAAATATGAGIVELADTTEATSGTDTTRAVTAAGVKAYVDAQGFSVDSDTLANKTLTSSTINGADITSNDGDLVDMSAINASGNTEGLILPQAKDVSAATAEGQISWDTDGDTLYVGNGTSTVAVSNPFGSAVDSSEITNGTIATVDIANAAVTEDKLAATLAFDDSDLINLSAINASGNTEGLILPQAKDVSAATAQGQISWDTDDDTLYVGNGTSTVAVGNPFGSAIDSSEITNGTVATVDIANAAVTEDKLAATLAFDDSDLINLSAINASGNAEGLILPQAADVSAATAEGQISWDTDDDILYVGAGTSQSAVASELYVNNEVNSITLDAAYDSGRMITVDAGAVQLTGSNTGDKTLEVSNSGNGGALQIENTGTGLTFRANDEASDTTPFVVDDSGRVGIGTSSPAAHLEIEASDPVLRLVPNGLWQSSTIQLTGARNSNGRILGSIVGYNTMTTTDETALGAIRFLRAHVGQGTNGTPAGVIVFETTSDVTESLTEVMRINQHGKVGIGTDYLIDALHVNGRIRLKAEANIGSNDACVSKTGVESILGICSSSIRYKGNVVDLDAGLELVQRMRPVSFVWKDVADAGLADVGFIAEEVAEVDTRLVVRDANENNRPVGVKYSHYTAVLTKAVQELDVQLKAAAAENEALKARVGQLEARIGYIEALEARLAALEAR